MFNCPLLSLAELASISRGTDHVQLMYVHDRKKLGEVEGKLKLVTEEKQKAVQEKANLERQLKMQQSQKLMIEKNLEKKDQIESKKRESIMVVGFHELRSWSWCDG